MTILECRCNKCKQACSVKPGWFLPGEVEKVAKYFNISLQDFFNQYLGVDWWEGDEATDNNIFVLAPAILNMKIGLEYPGDPHGQCVFFENNLCKIHIVKPFECAEFIHDDKVVVEKRHWKIAKAWQKHQFQINKLLGRKPKTRKY